MCQLMLMEQAGKPTLRNERRHFDRGQVGVGRAGNEDVETETELVIIIWGTALPESRAY